MKRLSIIVSYLIVAAASPVLAQNAYVNLGRQALMDGDFRTAVSHLEKACVVDSNNTNALWMLGYSYYHSENYKKSIAAYSRVIALKPADGMAYYYRARAKGYLGKDIQAPPAEKEKELLGSIIDFTKAIDIDGTDMKFYQNRAIAYREYGIFKLLSTKPADRARGINSLKASIADFEKVLSTDASRTDIEAQMQISKDRLNAASTVTAHH